MKNTKQNLPKFGTLPTHFERTSKRLINSIGETIKLVKQRKEQNDKLENN